jgi:hypothetical protein
VSAAHQHFGAWRWGALLAFALIAPVTLPAGGCDRRHSALRRRVSDHEPLLSPLPSVLRSSPQRFAPALSAISEGEPMRVLREWLSPTGHRWVRIEVRSNDLLHVRRGWLPIT